MPRSRHVFWIAAGAIVLAAIVVLAIAMRGGDDDHGEHAAGTRTRGDGNRTAESASMSGSTRDVGTTLNSATTPGGGPATAKVPLEAMPELAEAFRTARFQDAVELCGAPATLAAHQGDCTIAACRAHLEARARGWFAHVADDDRDRVATACEDAKVTLGPRIRPHPRPHGHRGVLD